VFTDDKESASAASDGNPIMEIQRRPALRKRDARLGRFTRHRVFGCVWDLALEWGLANVGSGSRQGRANLNTYLQTVILNLFQDPIL
jgi:hypothetical protein